MSATTRISRRKLLKTAGVAATGIALPAVWLGRAGAAEQITVADVGGASGAALRTAFYDPFEKATGVRVEGVAHESDPVTQFKVIVDTDSKLWDVCMVTPDDVLRLTQEKNYLEPLEITKGPGRRADSGRADAELVRLSAYGIVMAYRTDVYKKRPRRAGPTSGTRPSFQGAAACTAIPRACWIGAARRWRGAEGSLPLDVDRAFKMMDKIRSEVAVWWTAGAQNTQILQNGEVDMADTWSARAFAAIDLGASRSTSSGRPLLDRWLVDLLGTTKLKQAREFVKFSMQPERQAACFSIVANGPSNLKA